MKNFNIYKWILVGYSVRNIRDVLHSWTAYYFDTDFQKKEQRKALYFSN